MGCQVDFLKSLPNYRSDLTFETWCFLGGGAAIAVQVVNIVWRNWRCLRLECRGAECFAQFKLSARRSRARRSHTLSPSPALSLSLSLYLCFSLSLIVLICSIVHIVFWRSFLYPFYICYNYIYMCICTYIHTFRSLTYINIYIYIYIFMRIYVIL